MSGTVRAVFMAGCVVAVLSLAGCGGSSGPRRVAVRGAILFNNQPLKAGRIQFIPAEGSRGPAAVATVTDGFYDFDVRTGPVVGKHKVQIESMLDPGFALDDESAYARIVQEKGGAAALPPQPIPAEYNERSMLTVTVTPEGEKKLDFTL